MKVSTAQAFRSIASRIHPQVGLTTRESQRLLNALTASFKQHLDLEHPDTLEHAKNTPAAASSASDHAILQSSASSTERHLASILTNPLLVGAPTNRASAVAQLNNGAQHPVKIFEDCVAAGNATVEIARLCLRAFRKKIEGLTREAADKEIQNFAGGARVLRWMWANNQEDKLRTKDETKLQDDLVYFLVREGREETAWQFLTAETPSTFTTPETLQGIRETQKWRGYWLRSLVRAHLMNGGSAGRASAITTFFRAVNATSNAPASSGLRHLSLAPAGVSLTMWLTNTKWVEPVFGKSVTLFDRYVAAVDIWTDSQIHSLQATARLMLNHPTAPSASDALLFIRELKRMPDHRFLHPVTPRQKRSVLEFFFDTVQVLHKQGLKDDAAWVMEFMREQFSQELLDDQKTPAVRSARPAPQLEEKQSREGVAGVLSWTIPGLG